MTNQHTTTTTNDDIGTIASRRIFGNRTDGTIPVITVDSKAITAGVYVRIWEDASDDLSARIDLTIDQAKALVQALQDALTATMPTATLSRNGNLPLSTYSLYDENGDVLVGLGVKTWATAIDSAHAWCDAMGYRLVG